MDSIAATGGVAVGVTPRRTRSGASKALPREILQPDLYDTYAEQLPPPLPGLLLPITINRLRKIAARHGTELIIASVPGLFLALESMVVAKLLGIPWILDVRDAWQLEELTHSGRIRNLTKEWLEGHLCKNANKVWAVTDSLGKLITDKHHLDRDKIATVPNGADLARFRAIRRERKYDLVLLGAPSRYRRVSEVLVALQELCKYRPNLRAVWIGWQNPELTEEDRRRVAELTTSGTLMLVPPVSHSDVPEILAQAQIGIVPLSPAPAFRTAVGAKTYEYLASGLPIACIGPEGPTELRDLVLGEDAGLYATSVPEFVDNLRHMLADNELRMTMSKNSLHASLRFDRREIFGKAFQSTIAELDLDGTAGQG